VSDPSNLSNGSEADTEISLADIVEFIQESWKPVFLAAIVGAVLGFSNSFSLLLTGLRYYFKTMVVLTLFPGVILKKYCLVLQPRCSKKK
jgi:hypothetical protein